MSKKCSLLRREAHAEVKMWKAYHVRTTFGRSTAPHYTTTNWNFNYNYNRNCYCYYYYYYTKLHFIAPHYTTTLPLQPQQQLHLQAQLHHATSSSCVWGGHCNHFKKHNSNHFLSISGFDLPSMHCNNAPLLKFPIFETSATALRGTIGNLYSSVDLDNNLSYHYSFYILFHIIQLEFSFYPKARADTNTHTYIYIYVYIYMLPYIHPLLINVIIPKYTQLHI